MDGEIRSSGKHWTTAKSFMAECTPLVKAWIRYAEDDWHDSLILINAGGHQRNVCFHLQQCLEKLFKAELMRMEQPVPKVHNLRELSDLLHQADESWSASSIDLNRLSLAAVDFATPIPANQHQSSIYISFSRWRLTFEQDCWNGSSPPASTPEGDWPQPRWREQNGIQLHSRSSA